MVRKIAVINLKGGVGKTTTTVNLGHALALSGHKVTLIDLDPQGNLALCLGFGRPDSGLDAILLDNVDIENTVSEVRDGLQLVSSGTRLAEIDQMSEGGTRRGELLRTVLDGRFGDRDFLFLDCPLSSGLLVMNALFVADELLIPMTGEFLSLQGLAQLIRTIRKFEKTLNRNFKLWVVMSRFHSTRRLARKVLESIKNHFPENILATPVREAVLVAECPGFGKTVLEHRPGSRPARDFRSLAQDLVTERVM